jgi:Uma2 family endonuclease
MTASLALKLWSIDEYEQMIEKGILTKDHRVELIKGEIVQMAPIGIRHAMCVTTLEDLFRELLGRSVTIYAQNPILLPDNSEPQPDVTLLRGHRSLYKHRRPTFQDVLLLVEVSDTTLATDREIKVPLYAEAGIAQMWIVNLDEDMVEVYSDPAGTQYLEVRQVGRGQNLALPGGLPGEVAVDEVLG